MPKKSSKSSQDSEGSSQHYSDHDKKKLVSDAVFYIIAQEKNHPFYKKADVFKAIGLSGRGKALQDDVWHRVSSNLKCIFGYEIVQPDSDKPQEFYLRNNILDTKEDEMKHLVFSDKEEGHHGLLITVLSIIYMSNGKIKEDQMDHFLQKMNLWADDVGKKERRDSQVDNSIVEMFGNIKKDLFVNWSRKGYLEISKNKEDQEHEFFEYKWGKRATSEFKKSLILKWVAKIYDKPVTAFPDQYEEVKNSEGEEVFDEIEVESQNVSAMETDD